MAAHLGTQQSQTTNTATTAITTTLDIVIRHWIWRSPCWGGRAGWVMRYLCRPGASTTLRTLELALRQRRVNGTSGLTQPAPDSAPLSQHRAESGGGPQSQSVARGGWLQPQEGSQFVGMPVLGWRLGPSHPPYPRRQIIVIKRPGRSPGPGPVSSEAPEESLFQGRMYSGPSLASVPAHNAIGRTPSPPLCPPQLPTSPVQTSHLRDTCFLPHTGRPLVSVQ